MAHADFIHLRVHSAYSLSAGAIRIKELVGLCKRHKMPAVAISDSGNLFGALEFAQACIEVGVKQRRLTEKQLASVGGVWLPVSHWKSLTVGFGAGNLAAALAVPGPAAIAMAAAQARAATALAGCLSRGNKERTICTSIVAGMHRLPNGSGASRSERIKQRNLSATFI